MMSIGVWAVGLGGWGVNGVWLGQRWDVLDDQAGLDQEQVDLKNNQIDCSYTKTLSLLKKVCFHLHLEKLSLPNRSLSSFWFVKE